MIFSLKGDPITIQCTPTDTLNQVFDKFCFKAGQNRSDVSFYCDAQRIEGNDKTLFQLGITSNRVFND